MSVFTRVERKDFENKKDEAVTIIAELRDFLLCAECNLDKKHDLTLQVVNASEDILKCEERIKQLEADLQKARDELKQAKSRKAQLNVDLEMACSFVEEDEGIFGHVSESLHQTAKNLEPYAKRIKWTDPAAENSDGEQDDDDDDE